MFLRIKSKESRAHLTFGDTWGRKHQGCMLTQVATSQAKMKRQKLSQNSGSYNNPPVKAAVWSSTSNT